MIVLLQWIIFFCIANPVNFNVVFIQQGDYSTLVG